MDIKIIIALVVLTIAYIAALNMPHEEDIEGYKKFKIRVGICVSLGWVGTIILWVL